MRITNRIEKAIRGKVVPLIIVLAVTMVAQALTNVRMAMGVTSVTDLTTSSVTPDGLASLITGSGITFLPSATYTGDNRAGGEFTHDILVSGGLPGIGIDAGAVFSSGAAGDAVGPNISEKTQNSWGTPGDSLLSSVTGQPSKDAAVLEFEFLADVSNIEIKAVFGAEEYNEDVNDKFNNEFAIWINGNIVSLVPGTATTRVGINTINGGKPSKCSDHKDNEPDGVKDLFDPDCGGFCDEIVGEDNVNTYIPIADDTLGTQLFVNNDNSDPDGCTVLPRFYAEADGFTVPLTFKYTNAKVRTDLDNINTLRIAIADSRNRNFTSWVFIEAESLRVSCVDTDGDGWADPSPGVIDFSGCVGNVVDNCPLIYNPGLFDVDDDGFLDQLDNDDDGRGDICDRCPDDPLNDDDNDGVCGNEDNCPGKSNPIRVGEAAQRDFDGDTIGDECDNCPEIANLDQANWDADFEINQQGDLCDDDNENTAPKTGTGRPGQGGENTEFVDTDCDGLADDAESNEPDLILRSDPGLADTDSDGISDGNEVPDGGDCTVIPGLAVNSSNLKDNCPNVANSDQANHDPDPYGDACDDDDDGDGWDDVDDNCITDSNPLQGNMDGDSEGDVCDNDADADGFYKFGSGLCDETGATPELTDDCDCDDLVASVNPGMSETPNNGIDDDCKPATWDVELEIVLNTDGSLNFDIDDDGTDDVWLPEVGDIITLSAEVWSIPLQQFLNPATYTIEYSMVSGGVTSEPGQWYNDDIIIPGIDGDEDDDVSLDAGAGVLTYHDYGGMIRINVKAIDVTTLDLLVEDDINVPEDKEGPNEEGDGLPDAWEGKYGGDLVAGGDIDTHEGAGTIGDDILNEGEWRGVKWDFLVEDTTSGYKTTAYRPTGSVGHFRLDPTRKDLFVKFSGFDALHPFAIGHAWEEIRINLHPVNADDSAEADFLFDDVNTNGIPDGGANIDILEIVNEPTRTVGLDDSFNNWQSDWVWQPDTFGVSMPLPAGFDYAFSYGLDTYICRSVVDNYFGERRYIDGCPWSDAIQDCASPDPDGIFSFSENLDEIEDDGGDPDYNIKGNSEDPNGNLKLDGDRQAICDGTDEIDKDGLSSPDGIDDCHQQTNTTFDCDNDRKVELPVVTGHANLKNAYDKLINHHLFPDDHPVNYLHEYSMIDVYKWLCSHEITHATGVSHIGDGCLMDSQIENWSTDLCFSPEARLGFSIHNDSPTQ